MREDSAEGRVRTTLADGRDSSFWLLVLTRLTAMKSSYVDQLTYQAREEVASADLRGKIVLLDELMVLPQKMLEELE